MTDRGIIVVGVDGRPESDEALRFAAEEAARTGGTLEVLTCWTIEPSPISPYTLVIDLPTLDQMEAEARQRQDAAIARVLGDPPRIAVATRTPRGDVRPLLVEAGRHARMLVVGSRSMGPLKAALLGSVSRYCAHHATCPVVVVPSNGAASSARPTENALAARG